MHKGDYTHMGAPRWLDLGMIINKTNEIKSLNNNLKLINVNLKSQLESYPPRSTYEYTFKNMEDKHFKF